MSERNDLIAGLHELADFFEDHPRIEAPANIAVNSMYFDREEFIRAAREFGSAKKDTIENWFYLTKSFGNGAVTFDLNITRDKVCTKRVTGTRTVPRKPAVAEHEEEIVVEWECPDSILDTKGAPL